MCMIYLNNTMLLPFKLLLILIILQILIKVKGITIIINTLLYNMIKLKAISRINTLSDDDVDYADVDDNDNGDNDDIYMYVSSDDLT